MSRELTGEGEELITIIYPEVNYTISDSSSYFNDPISDGVIEVDVGGAILLITFYIPPASSIPGQTSCFTQLFNITRDVLVVVDFNAQDAR